MKPNDGKDFEKVIGEIYDVLKENNTQVTVNGKIADPDNPKQARQIDIIIVNGDIITLVECRDHNAPQNVKWIEELMGRMVSLNANYIIGVSSSGFTEGAIQKANKHGIKLRELDTLSSEELKAWGKECTIECEYAIFQKLKVIFRFDKLPKKELIPDDYTKFYDSNGSLALEILPDIIDKITSGEILENKKYKLTFGVHKTVPFNAELNVINFIVELRMNRSKVIHKISQASLFGSPLEDKLERTTSIQKFDYENWKIIENETKGHISFDVSQLSHPENSYLFGWKVSGLDDLKIYNVQVGFKGGANLFSCMEIDFTYETN